MQHKFLLNNLDHSDELQSELGGLGIHENDIHFVSEVSQDFAGHHIHEASIIEERDLVHSSIRGAMVGSVIGVVANISLFIIQPYGWQIEMLNMVLILLLTTGFGGWMGGLIGISHRNYRLSKYEDELKHGKAIMLVYTDDEHAEEAQRVIQRNHPDTKYLGKDTTFDNPLRNDKIEELEH